MSFSISRWKLSSTVWQSGQGVTIACGAVRLGRLDVLPGQLDRDALVMRRGVEAAAFGAAAVVDRPAAENLRELLQRGVVARVDETRSAAAGG